MNRTYGRTVLLFALLAFAGAISAQTTKRDRATISGVVYDANGKAVPAAAVTCQSSAGIRPRIVHTDAKGRYRVLALKEDAYDLRATAKGAYSDWEKNIPLHKGQNKEIDLHLLNGNTALSGILPSKKK